MNDQYDSDFNFLKNREHRLTEDKKITSQPEVRTSLDINVKKE